MSGSVYLAIYDGEARTMKRRIKREGFVAGIQRRQDRPVFAVGQPLGDCRKAPVACTVCGGTDPLAEQR